MPDPETEAADEIEDPELAEILALEQNRDAGSFDVPEYDQDGMPVWEQF